MKKTLFPFLILIIVLFVTGCSEATKEDLYSEVYGTPATSGWTFSTDWFDYYGERITKEEVTKIIFTHDVPNGAELVSNGTGYIKFYIKGTELYIFGGDEMALDIDPYFLFNDFCNVELLNMSNIDATLFYYDGYRSIDMFQNFGKKGTIIILPKSDNARVAFERRTELRYGYIFRYDETTNSYTKVRY